MLAGYKTTGRYIKHLISVGEIHVIVIGIDADEFVHTWSLIARNVYTGLAIGIAIAVYQLA